VVLEKKSFKGKVYRHPKRWTDCHGNSSHVHEPSAKNTYDVKTNSSDTHNRMWYVAY